jgi:NAD(P)-dependent dehydrogenase (short-subunit alcohol dehydrogenase family)
MTSTPVQRAVIVTGAAVGVGVGLATARRLLRDVDSVLPVDPDQGRPARLR